MDIQLHFTRQGSGPPLLLLHGNGEDGSYFVHQMAEFSKDFTVYAIDTRGHGQSPRGALPFTLTQFAEDLLDFMDRQSMERADILGFSDGGNIALLFALKYPERVGRLILNGANLTPSGVKWTVQLPVVLGYHICRRFKNPDAKAHAELLGLMVNEPHIDPADLSRLTMPVLVIAGTRDMIREAHTRTIAAALPHSRPTLLAGDHFIANKAPAAFNAAVRAFLSESALSEERNV